MSGRDERDERDEHADLRPDDVDGEPADLEQLRADDAFLDALGRSRRTLPGGYSSDADVELARLLTAWKDEVDADPVPELVSTDEALAAVGRARRPRRRRARLVPVAAAAAVIVVGGLAGVGVGAHSAEPGDRLFALTKVLYSHEANSEQAADRVESELEQASAALQRGDTRQTMQSLDRAQRQLNAVDADPEDHAALKAKIEAILQRLRERADDLRQARQSAAPAPGPSDTQPAQQEPAAGTTADEPTADEPTEAEQSQAPTTSNPPSEAPTSTTADEGTEGKGTDETQGKSGTQQPGQPEPEGSAPPTPTGRTLPPSPAASSVPANLPALPERVPEYEWPSWLRVPPGSWGFFLYYLLPG